MLAGLVYVRCVGGVTAIGAVAPTVCLELRLVLLRPLERGMMTGEVLRQDDVTVLQDPNFDGDCVEEGNTPDVAHTTTKTPQDTCTGNGVVFHLWSCLVGIQLDCRAE